MKAHITKLLSIVTPLAFAYVIVFWLSACYRSDSPCPTTTHVIEAESETEEVAPEELGPFDETLTIKAGDTLASVLNCLGIPSQQAYDAIAALSKVFNPKDLKVGQDVYVVYEKICDSNNLNLKFLRIRPDFDSNIELVQTGAGSYEATKYKKELKHHYVNVEGSINLSLYADALKAGASPKMLYDMIKAFSFDVDFQRDIHTNDQFSLFYDSYVDEESGLERPGELLYGKLILDGRIHELYRFQPPGSVPGYYTPKGDAVQKALLRTPIDGARVNSGFGNRKHPIKGYTKMHKGVDFGAATGTPIMAAGDGVVERCNWFSGYGKYICIRHDGSTKTAYAHLSRFAKGVSAGKRVKQGQIIGYVGSTGQATGPHLHFELIQNGKHVNPQKVTQLPKKKLGGKALAEFKSHITKIGKIMDTKRIKAEAQTSEEKEPEEKAEEQSPEVTSEKSKES